MKTVLLFLLWVQICTVCAFISVIELPRIPAYYPKESFLDAVSCKEKKRKACIKTSLPPLYQRTWRDSNPRHVVPETTALSPELQVLARYWYILAQFFWNVKCFLSILCDLLTKLPLPKIQSPTADSSDCNGRPNRQAALPVPRALRWSPLPSHAALPDPAVRQLG